MQGSEKMVMNWAEVQTKRKFNVYQDERCICFQKCLSGFSLKTKLHNLQLLFFPPCNVQYLQMFYSRHLQCFLFVLIITENDRRQSKMGRKEGERGGGKQGAREEEPVPASK